MKDLLLYFEAQSMQIQNGDFVIGNSSTQHKRLLLMFEKGALKEFPLVGIGANTFLESEDGAGFLRETRVQFQADGMEVKSLGFDANGMLKIDADYK